MADPLDILKMPGEGLLTVTTGSGQARRVLGPWIAEHSESQWRRLAARRRAAPGPQILALPSDAGGGICRGAAHGPLQLRAHLYARHPSFAAADLGDIPCIPQLLDDGMLAPKQLRASGRALWGAAWKTSTPVSPLNLLKSFLVQGFGSNPAGFRPLVLGGDHSTSWAVSEALFDVGLFDTLAVLHFDAHTDLLEQRYGVAHCFATWAAHAARRLRPQARANFVQVGVRVSGRSRSHWEKTYGLRQIWADEARARDPVEFARELVSAWKKRGCRRLYISFDVDALDPSFVPSTGTPEAKGLNPAWCRQVIRACARELPLVAADIVELAPVLGSASQSRRSCETAARVAATLFEGLRRGL